VSRLAVVALAAAGGLVTAAGLTQGWWWPAFGLGLGLGLATGRRARALAGGVVLGAIGWGLPLGLLLAAVPEARRLALVLSAILGARAAGVPAVALTLLTGCLLAVTGAWLGSAFRPAVHGRAWRR